MNEYLQQNFKDVGINVKIEALEAQVMQTNLSNGMPPTSTPTASASASTSW